MEPVQGRSRSLQDLLNLEEVLRILVSRGLAEGAARSRAELVARCAGRLIRDGAGAGEAAIAFFVPGRIEVLGKHTDYCGGRSLLAATEQGIAFVAVPKGGSFVEAADARSGERAGFEIAPGLEPRRGHWSNYPMTVARRIARNFPGEQRGARIAFASNLPAAAGMSSSSVLIVGFFLALAKAGGIEERPEYRSDIPDLESLAVYLATVENGSSFRGLAGDLGVGTEGGSEDHTTILLARPGSLSRYSFAPLRRERNFPLPPGLAFAVASSGIVAEKTGAARELFNRASRKARAAVELWNAAQGAREPHLAAILGSGGGSLEALRGILAGSRHPEYSPAELIQRAEHFHEESLRIVPEASERLERGDLKGFGDLADRSQEIGARLLGNQVPETVFLAREARVLGALAASAFGAGFGGSVWALVREAGAKEFLDSWRTAYRKAFPGPSGRSSFLLTGASGAASAISG